MKCYIYLQMKNLTFIEDQSKKERSYFYLFLSYVFLLRFIDSRILKNQKHNFYWIFLNLIKSFLTFFKIKIAYRGCP